jgi:hypothetical protein
MQRAFKKRLLTVFLRWKLEGRDSLEYVTMDKLCQMGLNDEKWKGCELRTHDLE